MSDTDQTRAWAELALARGAGFAAFSACGLDPEDFPELTRWSRSRLKGTGLKPEAVEALAEPDAERVAACLEWLAAEDHHLVAYPDPYYPPLLRRIPDPPVALFVNGQRDWLLCPQIAIVGSRNATPGGLETARAFAGALSACGFVIASGLALGIDGSVHAAALDAGGATIAVAGTGPDRVYPARHQGLAHRIVDNGAVVTHFAPGVGPRAGHFPARNRILSGLSLGVLVVEAGTRSGSLITARYAGDQGREVFAIPGSIHNPLARGCHRLIRQGARLVETAEEIVEELGPLVRELEGELRGLLETPARARDGSEDLCALGESVRHTGVENPEQRALLDALGHDPVSVDELIARTNLTTQQVSSSLLALELQGRVASLGGGRYSRVGNDQEGQE